MLPDGFRWQSIYGPGGHADTNALAYLNFTVARLDQKVDGTWYATLYHPGRAPSMRD